MAKNPLTQVVNFYISIGFIASFGFIIAISVIQSVNPSAPITHFISSPISFDTDGN
jgi:hypothetical protein